MLKKIVFISDRLHEFQTFFKTRNSYEPEIDLLNHSEAIRRSIFRDYYELFIVDLEEQWLAIPQWIREQAQQLYFHQFIFISNKAVNPVLPALLGRRFFKLIDFKTAADDLNSVVDEAKQYFEEHQYSFEQTQFLTEAPFEGLLGSQPSIKRINDFIKLVSRARYAPCLISGEEGSGKELCAGLIHRANDLHDDLLFVKKCEKATTNDLLGDLFGVDDDSGIYGPVRKGLIEMYAGGTIILKDIEKTPPEVQEKLLLYLEEKAFRPLGANRIIEANTRIIAMCEHNLEWFVKYKNFNSDLYFHLNAFEISLPPLRERGDDVLLLASYYLQSACQLTGKTIRGISMPAQRLLKKYFWPGNIKELKNLIEETVIKCKANEIGVQDLPLYLNNGKTSSPGGIHLGNCSLKEMERIHIEQVLVNTEGNKSKAATLLQISRTTLREKIKQYEL